MGAWVQAFSPADDRTGLTIRGDQRLAGLLLGALASARSERGAERAA
jgi:hypothetical protein